LVDIPVAVNHFPNLPEEPFLGFCAWPDTRSESRPLAHPVDEATVHPSRVLTDAESEEVEPGRTVNRFEGMSDARLAGLHLQSHAFEPFFRNPLGPFERPQIRMDDHEVVRIANDLWFPADVGLGVSWGLEVRERIPNGCFEAMEGDVGQKRRDNPALGCSLCSGEQFTPVHDAGLQPRLNRAAEHRERPQLGQQCLVVDPVERHHHILPAFMTFLPVSESHGSAIRLRGSFSTWPPGRIDEAFCM
jgi:hypothetical protein